METASMDHHGREITYRHHDAEGEGLTLLCVHGSDGARGAWRGQLRFTSNYPVAALDLSGHGNSDDVNTNAGYETLSAYVNDVITVTGETDVSILVGNSLDGAVVLTLALERGLDLDALVFAGTGAKLAVLSDLLGWPENDFDRAVSFLHGEDKLFHTDDKRLVEGSKEAMYDVGQAVTLRDFLSCHMFNMRDGVSEISVPTLTLIGEYDRLTPPSYHEYLAEAVPDGELGTVEDAARLAMLERPVAFNETMKSSLDCHIV